MKKRTIALMLAVVMLFGAVIGGTIAWLTSQTDPVVNTFTVGDINITLVEDDSHQDANSNPNDNAYKMIPGNTIDKNPIVTVKANSEDCYVFVKIEESAVLDNYITYVVADGWTELSAGSNIWWREQSSANADVPFNIIGNKGFDGDETFVPNKVLVKQSVTKTMMNALQTTGAVQPTLTFTAYAVQKANVADATAAWAILNPTP